MAWDQILAQFVLLLFAGVVFQLCDSSEPVHRLFGRRLVASSDGHSRVLCPSNWVINQNKTKCFQFIATSKSWDESESYCKHTRGHLASLTSLQELNLAHKLCNKNGNGCWVGGRGINDTKGTSWVWSDRMSRDNDSVLLTVRFGTNCSKASCYNGSMVGLCTLLVGGQGLLSAEKCNKSHAFICMTNAEDKCSHGHCHREYTIILAVISGIILSTTLGAVIYLLASRRSKKRRKPRKQSDPTSSTSAPPSWKIFTIEELRSITKRFNEGNRLPGDAKTGGTYNGTLPDGSNVAVKRLKRPGFQRKKEFYSEVGRIARLRHPSLVSVKGCCYDHGDRYFVYEFIVNGPLDRWLHHVPRGGRCLNWAMRMKIAMSLAQGIAFLHDKVKPQVVHRDIRASNVLLDESFGAHLMGVGLSKFIPWEAIHEKTIKAGGTYGYLAPEFVYRNELTTKSDVYSFGVLLLEIVTGRKPAQAVDSVGWQSIFEWATPLVQAHQYPDLLDPMMVSGSSGEIPEAGVIQKVVDLVYACTQHVPSIRPRMSHVVHQLQQLSPPASAVE